jgi:hypothetical protein
LAIKDEKGDKNESKTVTHIELSRANGDGNIQNARLSCGVLAVGSTICVRPAWA